MIQTIRKAWGIPELRKKIIFTALILLIFRIGNAIPVPYVDTGLLNDYIKQLSTTVLGLYNVMSGGAFAEATVFALGVQPYINSSIIIQLLTIAIPALERLAREGGEEGKKKIQSITRYATVAIAILQGWGYYMLMKNYGILTNTGVWAALVIIVILHRRLLLRYVDGRADHRVRYRQRHLHHPVRRYPVPCARPWSRIHGLRPEGGYPGLVGRCAGGRRYPGTDRADHLGQRRRAPHPGAVRQASGGPQDVRRPEHPPSP